MFWCYGALAIVVGAGIWLWWIRHYDRFEPEPLRALLRIGLLGGALSAMLALLAGLVTHPFFHGYLGLLVAGTTEEITKSWATVTLLKRRSLVDEPVDVLVYALTVALGFALFENLLYFLPGGAAIPLTRSLYSIPAHLGFAMIWAVPLTPALWGDRARKHPYRHILPAIFAAGVVHGTTNLLLEITEGWVLLAWMAVPLVAMVILGRAFLRRYSARSPFKPLITCPFCGRDGDPRGKPRCAQCGSPLARTRYLACPSCQGPVPPAAIFCQHCGIGLPERGSHVP